MCTGIRFADPAGTMYFGRNLDWTTSYGERVVVTPPAAKVPAAFERAGDPERGHAVIGMGIIVEGIPLYFDCGNDAGLAVAGLNFPQSARYAAEPAPTGVNVAAYEFPFWVARNFATLDEVRAALENVTVVARAVNDELPVANLHWIIGDETGSIAVECLEDGMRVWEDDVDVLTNEPTFCWHRQNLRNYISLTEDEPAHVTWDKAELIPFGSGPGMQGIPGDYSGPARFVKAAFVNGHYPEQASEADNVTRLFRTLGSVAVPDGCARMADGSYEKTLYTSGFSSARCTYYHASYDDPQIRAYPLSSCDLSGVHPFVMPDAA
ncbi:choloylglycine hydrolase [Collinsella ihumii]|uniref:choloylglycine hydrolase n=1 Tax=Collinsella ihumii TaxID=1720204 RepID=A0AAW7JX41_9ACTN|nr:choloylglycine hydrolase [Collinsella ihumii]MDN0070171.1 choloylglycine hydrolase [Collinsella ihumii]